MSCNGDSSQSSDISGISRISYASSIRPSSKAYLVFNISECQASSTIREPANRCTIMTNCTVESLPSSSPLDTSKILKLMTTCENSMTDHARLKVIYDCLHELAQSEDGTLPNVTSSKLKGLIGVYEASNYIKLPNTDKGNHEELSLLGITDLPKIHLTHDEKSDIRIAVEKIVQEKMNNFLDCYEKSGGNIEELLKSHESAGKTILSESHGTDSMPWKDTIDVVCTEYFRDLLRCADMVCQWQRLKYFEMRQLNTRNAENILLQAQCAEAQANITRKTCASRMFNETPTTADSFKILSDRLDSMIFEIRDEIEKKKILSIKYTDVSSPEYNHLVNKYAELCGIIKKKEHLLEML